MIHLKDIQVTFPGKHHPIKAVKNVNLSIKQGEIFGIVGYSGAGKSTLVRVINYLQPPTSGQVLIQQQDLGKLSTSELRQARKKIGMIFQHFNLMEARTIADNVAFPLKRTGLSKQAIQQKVTSLLELVGIADKANQYPSQLSGGQKQRVAIARALATDPEILLCDEATSALDPKTTLAILELLRELNQRLHLTIVLISHQMEVVKAICQRVAVMEQGQVIESDDIVRIFSQPKKEVTKDFIQTANHFKQALATISDHPAIINITAAERVLHLSYVGDQTNQPLIAHLYSQYQVEANILYGEIDVLNHTPIGQLIVILAGEPTQIDKAIAYLRSQQVTVKQVNLHPANNQPTYVEEEIQ